MVHYFEEEAVKSYTSYLQLVESEAAKRSSSGTRYRVLRFASQRSLERPHPMRQGRRTASFHCECKIRQH